MEHLGFIKIRPVCFLFNPHTVLRAMTTHPCWDLQTSPHGSQLFTTCFWRSCHQQHQESITIELRKSTSPRANVVSLKDFHDDNLMPLGSTVFITKTSNSSYFSFWFQGICVLPFSRNQLKTKVTMSVNQKFVVSRLMVQELPQTKATITLKQ